METPPPLSAFTLRFPTEADRREVLAASERSRVLHRGWSGPPLNDADYDRWLAAVESEFHQRRLVRVGDQLIGVVNLHSIVTDEDASFANLGYLAYAPAAGRGLMRRAVALLVDEAFGPLGLHRVDAGIRPENVSSIALIKALGFWYEGLMRGLIRIDGEWRDHELWAMTEEHWDGAASLFD